MAKHERPRLSAVAIVHKDGKILVGARRRGPNKESFVLPGGGVEFGESIAYALAREVYEETGLEVTVEGTPLDVIELIGKKSHRVLIAYLASQVAKAEPVDTDELKDVHYASPEELIKNEDIVQRWVMKLLRRLGMVGSASYHI